MNQLYYGNNLPALREHIADQSADVIISIRRVTRRAITTYSSSQFRYHEPFNHDT
jgi:hypothetical protein